MNVTYSIFDFLEIILVSLRNRSPGEKTLKSNRQTKGPPTMKTQTLTQSEVTNKCNTPNTQYIEYNILENLFGAAVEVIETSVDAYLEFSNGNGKVNETAKNIGIPQARIACFDLPAGYTCPKANLCLAYAHRKTGRLIVSKDCEFECYAAKAERFRHSSRNLHWRNYDKLRVIKDNAAAMTELIMASLPKLAKGFYKLYVVRIHSSGDFFNEKYYQAWKNVAAQTPGTLYYGYTKILDYVLDDKPENFHLIYSYGGKDDSRRDEIAAAGTHVPTCYVISDPAQAAEMGLPIACPKNGGVAETNDIIYIVNQESFCLMVH